MRVQVLKSSLQLFRDVQAYSSGQFTLARSIRAVRFTIIMFVTSCAISCNVRAQVASPDRAYVSGLSIGESSRATKIANPDNAHETTILDRNDAIDQLLTRLALSHIPAQYVDDRKWGGQSERWDGISIEIDDGRLETHRRKKLVNHGTWKKYTAALRNPEQEFQVQIRDVKSMTSSDATSGKLIFSTLVTAHVNFKAQQVEWKKGVKLLSLTVEGHTQVHIQVNMELEVTSVDRNFPPDLVLKPRATQVKLQFDDFRIDRVGKVGGELAQQLSREASKRLAERMPEYEQKILDKINRELSNDEGGYRFAFADIQKSKWSRTLMDLFRRSSPNTTPGPVPD